MISQPRLVIAALLLSLLHLQLAAQPRTLVASLALLPGLADSSGQGSFVDLVQAMDKIYPGEIEIKISPFARSFSNVIHGNADFHIPAMSNPAIRQENLPYRYVREKIGSVSMVLYSNSAKPILPRDMDAALKSKSPFPYVIEVAAGAEGNCPFPARPSNNWEQSIKKLALGRIDGIWNPQEEVDLVIRQLKQKNIVRTHYGSFNDVIVVQKSRRGDEVDSLLTGVLRQLSASGKLEELYRKVHLPYNDWQPAQQKW